MGFVGYLCSSRVVRSYLGHCPAPLCEPLLLSEMDGTAAQDGC